MTKNTAIASYATFIASLCGDKQATVAVRQANTRAAIVVALKGTKEHWMAAAAAAGKGKNAAAKALLAAFMAVGTIGVLIKPQETITAEEKAARIDARADELLAVFEAAYTEAMPAEKTDEEKAAAKDEKAAAKAAALADAVKVEIEKRGLVPAGAVATEGDMLAGALALLIAGKVGGELADQFRAALGFEAAKSAAFEQGKVAGMAEAMDAASGASVAVSTASKGKRAAKLATAN